MCFINWASIYSLLYKFYSKSCQKQLAFVFQIIHTVFWANIFSSLMGYGGDLLGKIWLKHEADLLSVSSAEFQDTRNHDCMVHKHVYAVENNGHNIGWRERENQQDATNLMFIIQLISQHVSGIIISIIRRTRLCTTSCGLLHWLWWLRLYGSWMRAVCTVRQLLFVQ